MAGAIREQASDVRLWERDGLALRNSGPGFQAANRSFSVLGFSGAFLSLSPCGRGAGGEGASSPPSSILRLLPTLDSGLWTLD